MRTIDDDLTELVFENVDESTAVQLAAAIASRQIEMPTRESGVVDVPLDRVDIGLGVLLTGVHMRVLRYEDTRFDVEVNFIPRDAEISSASSWVDALHQYAVRLGRIHNVSSFFAGLDPAVDEKTRYFTGTEPGPYYS